MAARRSDLQRPSSAGTSQTNWRFKLSCVSEAPPVVICSAKGCRAPAVWSLRWNNPRLHSADRRKTWLACAEHRARLGEFLEVRGFLREVAPLHQSPTLDT